MKIPRGVWLKRSATATSLALVCLAMNSAAGVPGDRIVSADDSPTNASATALGGSMLGEVVTEAPASVTEGTSIRASASQVRTKKVSVGNGVIPDVALHAYQRAATIIAASDPTCGLRWELIAAIGRVESDHGRHGNSELNKQGVARPAIIGVPLNGAGHTARIKDTDAGALDQDSTHDRAVGPMQFIPSTWSVVGVDADGDGRRDPQDIDDAALATAVHLCGGAESLTKDDGLRTAVLRYNRSEAYADLVISLQDEYVAGNYSAPPTPTLPSTTPVSARPDLSGVDQTLPTTTPPSETEAPLKATVKSESGRKSEPGQKVDTRAKPDRKPTRAKDGVKSVGGVKVKPKKSDKDTSAEVPEVEVPEECLPEETENPAETDVPGEETQDATTSDEDPPSDLAQDPMSEPTVDSELDGAEAPADADAVECIPAPEEQKNDQESEKPHEKTLPKATRN